METELCTPSRSRGFVLCFVTLFPDIVWTIRCAYLSISTHDMGFSSRSFNNDLDLLRIAAFLDVQVAIRDPSVRCPFPSRFRGLRKYASDVEAKVQILHHYRL